MKSPASSENGCWPAKPQCLGPKFIEVPGGGAAIREPNLAPASPQDATKKLEIDSGTSPVGFAGYTTKSHRSGNAARKDIRFANLGNVASTISL